MPGSLRPAPYSLRPTLPYFLLLAPSTLLCILYSLRLTSSSFFSMPRPYSSTPRFFTYLPLTHLLPSLTPLRLKTLPLTPHASHTPSPTLLPTSTPAPAPRLPPYSPRLAPHSPRPFASVLTPHFLLFTAFIALLLPPLVRVDSYFQRRAFRPPLFLLSPSLSLSLPLLRLQTPPFRFYTYSSFLAVCFADSCAYTWPRHSRTAFRPERKLAAGAGFCGMPSAET